MATVVLHGATYTVDGAQIAIIENGAVLVQFRPFPPGWELPGGHCDGIETPSVCAVREASEETGLQVRILGMVGLYRWFGLRRAGDVLFAAEVVGGRRRRTMEAWASRYVDASCLPRALFPWHRQRIEDALAFAPGTDVLIRDQRIGPLHVLIFAIGWLLIPAHALDRWLRARRRTS